MTYPLEGETVTKSLRNVDARGRFVAIDVKERIRRRITISESGCWVWTGHKQNQGYGTMSFKGRNCLVHRVSYEVHVGPITRRRTIDHLCKNPPCCNPEHLEVVTLRVNVLRGNGMSARHVRATHCKRGHRKTKANSYVFPDGRRYCRLCRNIVDRIRREKEKADGVSTA